MSAGAGPTSSSFLLPNVTPSSASRALRCHSASLITAITDPLDLAWKLFAKEIIEEATRDEVKLQHRSVTQKNSILVSAVMRRVEARPNIFHQFVDILKENEDDILRELGGKLETTYSECLKNFTPEQISSTTKQVQYSFPPQTQEIISLSTKQIDSPSSLPTEQMKCSQPSQTQVTHLSPPTKQIKLSNPKSISDSSLPSIVIHPSLLPRPSQSPVCCYADYLRAFYQTSELPAVDKWPPSPSEIFINLAVISREKVSSKDIEKFTLATLHGGVDQILDIKAPIQIEEIFNSQPGKTLQCILVEGAPGVGKTTLAWEVSKQWGMGNLFQQFAIVMLLRLRDQTVQNADNLADLIFDQDQDCVQDISKHLKEIKGRNILIVLEGLDELPTHLLTQSSIFTRLLSGKILPQATILVTSRPSATVHLWNNWKHRVSRHIEVLGFTEESITQYIESVLSSQELRCFHNYLSINPHIRTIMYIPLHAAIVIEVYRMCQDSSKTFPTTITELYTCFVQTVLLRYITSQTEYKGKELDLDKFTNLPPPIYDLFYNLARLAYNSVTDRQLIFKHQQHTIQHLGFMDVVTELFPNRFAVSYSYNFLHLSIQEYLAAYYVSTMEVFQQEQLLRRMCTERHLQNIGRFLAGITKFEGMDRAIVKKTIQEECKSMVEHGGLKMKETIQLSAHAFQLLYESGDASILGINQSYRCSLTDHNPLCDFSRLGYCITHSNCNWTLSLGTPAQYIKSTEGIKILLQALKCHSNSSYTSNIDSIYYFYDAPECIDQLLTLPENDLQQLVMWCKDENCQPLPQCVSELPLTMSRLHTLTLGCAKEAAEVHRTVKAVVSTNKLKRLALPYSDIDDNCVTTLCQWLCTSSQLEAFEVSLPSPNTIEMISTVLTTNSTIKTLGLQGSIFNVPAMQAVCSMLNHNNTISKLWLRSCHIDDDVICCLANGLQSNNTITTLDIRKNSTSDRGAICVAEMLKINNTLQELDLSNNYIKIPGQKALKEVQEAKKHIQLIYMPQR